MAMQSTAVDGVHCGRAYQKIVQGASPISLSTLPQIPLLYTPLHSFCNRHFVSGRLSFSYRRRASKIRFDTLIFAATSGGLCFPLYFSARAFGPFRKLASCAAEQSILSGITFSVCRQ
jgi:hypothetical protein